MRRDKKCLALLLLLLLLLPSLAQAAATGRVLYATGGVYYEDTPDPKLYTLDPVTGAVVNSVAMTIAGDTIYGCAGLAINPVDGKLYALLQLNSNGGFPRMLATVDPATGVATAIGLADDGSENLGLAEMTFTNDGTLYAVSGNGHNPFSLFTLSPATGAATLIVALPLPDYAEVITFNPLDGLLYNGTYSGGPVLQTIDPANPLNPPVNIPLTGDPPTNEPHAMTYWNGFFIWATYSDLYLIRPDGVSAKMTTAETDSYPRGLAVGGSAPFCPQTLYGAAHQPYGYNESDAPSFFLAIDPSSGATQMFGPIGFRRVNDIDFDATGKLYATGQRLDDTNTQVLFTIDACTGKGTEIGPTGTEMIQDISFRPVDDVLFAVVGSPDQLVTLDKTTGAATVIGTLEMPWGGGYGLAFNLAGDTLYSNSFETQFTLDTQTGLSSVLGTLTYTSGDPAESRLNAMDVNPFTGAIYASQIDYSSSYLSIFDPQTMTVTAVGPTQGGLASLAFGSGQGYTKFNVAVTKSGNGAGTVTGNGINCGTTCQVTLDLNTAVTLTATPQAGSTFVAWTGACIGTDPCIFNLTQNQTVDARFETATADFEYGPKPDDQTITAGQSAHYNITINGGSGFTGTVTFACTAGLPKGAVCTFTPGSVTPGPNGSASTGLTISTAARQIFSMDRRPLLPGSGPLYATLLPMAAMAFIGLGAGRSQPRRRRLAAFFIFFVLLMMGAGLLGCGSTPVNPSVTNMNATPAGAYAVTVTGTSGAVSHAVNVNLNVN